MTNTEEQKQAQAESEHADAPAEGLDPATASTETGPATTLESELELAREDTQKFKDLALRAEAEMQNVRRRAERDVENAHKYGLERFIQNLLPLADALEKAIESAEQAEGADSEASRAIIEGIGLCQKMLHDVLGKEGIDIVDPFGEPFDPNLHQAISMVENPNVEPNSVVAVIQKGYSMNARLVRPAMVMVSKSAPPPAEES